VENNLLRGMVLVLVILGLFLFSVRTALIVAVTIPFACCSRSSAWTGGTFRPTCFPSAPSISESSWMAPW
jgi:hypothetical protein